MAMMMRLQRPITSGSRQAPDPYDQYLESRCLYRKHTARDASSLFRAIAEQMYDTQMLHYEVRLECVRFMTQKRRIFEKDIHGDFDSYMIDMSKPKTYGTMTELRAMCCLYRRNVILFEPYNMGSSVIFNRRYSDNFRVFYNNENHFDSVYKVEYIEKAAICQSIAFKLLYKMLFKLPDVNFAVESMLHPHTFEWDACDEEFDNKGYMIHLQASDGRKFKLDLPEHTNCILENYKLCNFHRIAGNQSNSNGRRPGGARRDSKSQLDHDSSGNNGSGSSDIMHMCPNRLVSCVRQLLDDGITPFPYKVAKSLDPFMYRNIEFDCWNDIRKEAKRYNAYANDYNFKVPYESLHPVPPDEFRPWTLPYRYQRQMQHHRMQLSKVASKPSKMAKWKKTKLFEIGQYFEPRKVVLGPMQGYVPLDNCYRGVAQNGEQRDPEQQNHGVDHSQREQSQREGPQKPRQQRTKELRVSRQISNAPSHSHDSAASAALPPPTHFMNYLPIMSPGHHGDPAPPSWPASPVAISEELQYPLAGPPPPPPADGCVYMPFNGYGPPPTGPLTLPGPHPFLPPSHAALNTQTAGGEPRRSLHMNGEDLPADVGTLRYFYNMGVDMHLRMSSHPPTPEEIAMMHNNTDQSPLKSAGADRQAGGEATPPPSPEAGNAVDQRPPLEKAYTKRHSNPNRALGKRSEPLHDLKDPLGHTALLPTPTPTPSPTTNGSQFSFYSSPPQAVPPPPPHHLVSPPRMLQQPQPPPIFFHKAAGPGMPSQLTGAAGGQNPYAWGMPPPTLVAPPYEMIGNLPIEQPPQQPQQHQPTTMPTSPAQAQPAAVYAAPRHH
ncbi:deubiquitinase otu isoform X1 [Drosophila kikkawai]|uniref:Deubiquitinase otu isoform X1 n=1 Tax=Drosophila kikkawai TaxID=30033 RepID=A0A6P4HNL6_DROKI|nr:protein ovarian tumor locus isoform X1 [Drosophila kikkawai]XP_017017376.1 protein ovarian tumor locus isoform X1 [Drosophila kikkawai]XP_017017377.1 protein ovarian tumor locus isoform X1 [Drosophila kikkawai]KAH8327443.1 hypothetical protein KR059_001775 [Drosophila kikkawai]